MYSYYNLARVMFFYFYLSTAIKGLDHEISYIAIPLNIMQYLVILGNMTAYRCLTHAIIIPKPLNTNMQIGTVSICICICICI